MMDKVKDKMRGSYEMEETKLRKLSVKVVHVNCPDSDSDIVDAVHKQNVFL